MLTEGIFTEKYRPQMVEDVVGGAADIIRPFMKNPKSMPHFLFYSNANGVGKSSMAKAIVRQLGLSKNEVMTLNASNDRKIETIRDKVLPFVRSRNINPEVRKIVFLDEAERLTTVAQEALLNMMETYSDIAQFILTTNRINLSDNGIVDRCEKINFAYPKADEIFVLIQTMCEEENIAFTEQGLNRLIEMNYPSIRSMVKGLQSLKTQDREVTFENVAKNISLYDTVWDMVKEKDLQGVQRFIIEEGIDCRDLNMHLWHKSLMESDPPNMKALQITCQNEKAMATGSNPQIVLVTSLLELVK